MASLVPGPEQIKTLVGQPADKPLVMVNLLKFRTKAAYGAERPEASEALSGRQAYRRYGAVAEPRIAAIGGKVLWGGRARFPVIGDVESDGWDEVLCVYYPSPAAFLTMTQDPKYLAVHYHREAALERTVLICCDAGI